jgi:hypothetical protein
MSDGRCLRHAYDEVRKREANHENVVYVQGVVTNSHEGKTFAHAWVETKTEVIDPTIGVTLPKARYYATFKPKNIIRMSPFIMTILCAKGHRFFTKKEVTAAIEKDKAIMASLEAKRKKTPPRK